MHRDRALQGKKATMTNQASSDRKAYHRRTPQQLRAANVRLGVMLLAIVLAFMIGPMIQQGLFG